MSHQVAPWYVSMESMAENFPLQSHFHWTKSSDRALFCLPPAQRTISTVTAEPPTPKNKERLKPLFLSNCLCCRWLPPNACLALQDHNLLPLSYAPFAQVTQADSNFLSIGRIWCLIWSVSLKWVDDLHFKIKRGQRALVDKKTRAEFKFSATTGN